MKHILKCVVVFTFFSFARETYAISNISVENNTLIPSFNEQITKYNVYVTKETQNVNVSASLSETDDYITGTGNINIVDGKNEVILKVIKKDGQIASYTVVIFKNYEENSDTDNATLSKLKIEGYEIDFDTETFEYKIDIANEERLDISYEQTNENSTVKISGNSNFKIGENIVQITVISKSKNNSNTYTLKIIKTVDVFDETDENEEDEDEKNILGKKTLTKKETNIIIIVLISICLIIITFTFYLMFIFRKKKKS